MPVEMKINEWLMTNDSPFIYRPISKDQNSLYNAVIEIENATDVRGSMYGTAEILRSCIADHLTVYRNRCKATAKFCLNNYAQGVRVDAEADNKSIEISALVYMLYRTIVIVQSDGSTRMYCDENNPREKKIFIFYNQTDGYYDALILKKGRNAREIEKILPTFSQDTKLPTKLASHSTVSFTTASISLDLTKRPEVLNKEFVEVTEGDVHGNYLRIIYTLIRMGICELDEQYYNELVRIYQYFSENRLYNEQLATFYQSEETRNNIAQFKAIIDERLKVIDKTKVYRLIGDILADRGPNDFFILYILYFLHQKQVAFRIIFSNHDNEFLKAFFSCFDPENNSFEFAKENDQGFSLLGLQMAIKEEVIAWDEVKTMVEEAYLPYLMLCDYSLDENRQLTFYSHAPNQLDILKEIAHSFSRYTKYISCSDYFNILNTQDNLDTNDSNILQTFIEQINFVFSVAVIHGCLYLDLHDNDYGVICNEMIWATKDLKIYHDKSPYQFVFGHKSFSNYSKSAIPINSLFGKYVWETTVMSCDKDDFTFTSLHQSRSWLPSQTNADNIKILLLKSLVSKKAETLKGKTLPNEKANMDILITALNGIIFKSNGNIPNSSNDIQVSKIYIIIIKIIGIITDQSCRLTSYNFSLPIEICKKLLNLLTQYGLLVKKEEEYTIATNWSQPSIGNFIKNFIEKNKLLYQSISTDHEQKDTPAGTESLTRTEEKNTKSKGQIAPAVAKLTSREPANIPSKELLLLSPQQDKPRENPLSKDAFLQDARLPKKLVSSSTVNSTTASISLDLTKKPEVLNKEFVEVTEGDVHGNYLRIIYTLIRMRICELDEQYYNELVRIYQYFSENRLYNEQLATFYHSEETRNNIAQFKAIIDERLKVIDKTKVYRLIGDILADRGPNDFFILYILYFLHQKQVPFRIIFSNHDNEFLKAFFSCFDPENNSFEFAKYNDQGFSLLGLQMAIKEEVIAWDEVKTMVEEAYLPYLMLCDYSLDENRQLTFYSHAPNRLDMLKNIAQEFYPYTRYITGDFTLLDDCKHGSFDINSADTDILQKLIKQINLVFSVTVTHGCRYLYLYSDESSAVFQMIWATNDLKRYHDESSYQFVFGHKIFLNYSQNAIPIDSLFGKCGLTSQAEDNFTFTSSHAIRSILPPRPDDGFKISFLKGIVKERIQTVKDNISQSNCLWNTKSLEGVFHTIPSILDTIESTDLLALDDLKTIRASALIIDIVVAQSKSYRLSNDTREIFFNLLTQYGLLVKKEKKYTVDPNWSHLPIVSFLDNFIAGMPLYSPELTGKTSAGAKVLRTLWSNGYIDIRGAKFMSQEKIIKAIAIDNPGNTSLCNIKLIAKGENDIATIRQYLVHIQDSNDAYDQFITTLLNELISVPQWLGAKLLAKLSSETIIDLGKIKVPQIKILAGIAEGVEERHITQIQLAKPFNQNKLKILVDHLKAIPLNLDGRYVRNAHTLYIRNFLSWLVLSLCQEVPSLSLEPNDKTLLESFVKSARENPWPNDNCLWESWSDGDRNPWQLDSTRQIKQQDQKGQTALHRTVSALPDTESTLLDMLRALGDQARQQLNLCDNSGLTPFRLLIQQTSNQSLATTRAILQFLGSRDKGFLEWNELHIKETEKNKAIWIIQNRFQHLIYLEKPFTLNDNLMIFCLLPESKKIEELINIVGMVEKEDIVNNPDFCYFLAAGLSGLKSPTIHDRVDTTPFIELCKTVNKEGNCLFAMYLAYMTCYYTQADDSIGYRVNSASESASDVESWKQGNASQRINNEINFLKRIDPQVVINWYCTMNTMPKNTSTWKRSGLFASVPVNPTEVAANNTSQRSHSNSGERGFFNS